MRNAGNKAKLSPASAGTWAELGNTGRFKSLKGLGPDQIFYHFHLLTCTLACFKAWSHSNSVFLEEWGISFYFISLSSPDT